eukprot:200027-Prorocentrum_minimum.AAC.1
MHPPLSSTQPPLSSTHHPLSSHNVHRCFVRDLDQSEEPVRCTLSSLLGVPGVCNVGNTRVLDVCAPRVLYNAP